MMALKPRQSLWWAVMGSNHRPPRCQRLSSLQVIELYGPDLLEIAAKWSKVRKSAQVIMRKLRYGESMKHYYPNVPKLGNIAVTRHAQARMEEIGITQEVFDKVLLEPNMPDIPDGQDILWREGLGIRIVILTNPTPATGAKLVKSVYRIKPQAKAK